MLASIWLEKKGVPALAICTEPFTGAVKALTRIHGVEGIKWAILPHPVGSLTPEVLRERAKIVVETFYDAVLERHD